MNKQERINWIIQQHRDTNHMYDEYLPYEFHLKIVVEVFKKFKYILPKNLFTTPPYLSIMTPPYDYTDYTELVIEFACWGHDGIEDARLTYNDVKEKFGKDAAEIIRAVTNYSRGRDRNERMPDFVYEDIRNTPGATFVKLCDRIANVQYGKMMGSGMYKKYQKENEHFLTKLEVINMDTIYNKMVQYLNNLLK